MRGGYVRGRHNKACCALIDVLRKAGAEGVSVGHTKDGLIVLLESFHKDASKVPAEFAGYAVRAIQDPEPYPPRMHEKVGDGCAHNRWELRMFQMRGIVPNRECPEPAWEKQGRVGFQR